MIMNDIDDFLKDIESKHQKKSVPLNSQNKHPILSNSVESQDKNKDNIDSFLSDLVQKKSNPSPPHDLLSEIESNFSVKKKSIEPQKTPDLLVEIESKFSQQKTDSTEILTDIEANYQQKQIKKSHNSNSIEANFLENIEANYKQKQAEIKQSQKTENLEEIRQKELQKQKEEKLLIRKAETWLKNLDPYSDEGFWFEQFALSYPSKLAAAMDYLKALQ